MNPLERAQTRVGTMLRSKYQLDTVLGVGGMAAVYSATHRNGSRVAVKVLHAELSLTESVRTRFLREGYAANKIDHPGVTRVIDDDVDDDGTVFLVIELLEGETLDAIWRSRRKKLGPNEVVRYLEPLLDVLEAAHQCGVIHRDIKPENIFITTEGELKVLDFGIARIVDAVALTQSGVAVGTPHFMAPEQAGGRVREIDHRSDIWAVGATAFTLLSGEHVHGTGGRAVLLTRAATAPVPPLASVCRDVPVELAAIIDTALRMARRDRWSSAREMQLRLRALATSSPEPSMESTASPIPPGLSPTLIVGVKR